MPFTRDGISGLVDEYGSIGGLLTRDGEQLGLGRTYSSNTLLVGDSMVGREWLDSSTDVSKVGYGWVNHFNLLSKQAFNVIANMGVTGRTSAELVAALPDVVRVARRCGWTVLSIGTNDYYGSLLTPDIVLPNMEKAISALLATGTTLVVMGLTPRTFVDANKVAYCFQTNNWLENRLRGERNGIYFDAGAAIVDATSTQYAAASGVLDGSVHLTNIGGHRVGAALNTLLSSRVVRMDRGICSPADTYAVSTLSAQAWGNPMFTGTGGTFANSGTGQIPTGTGPDSVQVDHAVNTTGTCVVSTAARTVANDGDALGNNIRLQIGVATPAGANDRWTVRCSGNLGASQGIRFGDVMQLEGYVRVASHTNLAALPLFMQVQVDGGSIVIVSDMRNDSVNATYDAGFVGGFYRTRPFRVPLGSTLNAFQWRCEPRFVTANGAADIFIGRVRLMNLTRLGIDY